ncbi:hypothetical protein C8R45DRAFT_929916 [Mycena sanguinolenta]|nr:hypothetical protein C8R45DRAFT_929916 [Mycena sanguinolenta]
MAKKKTPHKDNTTPSGGIEPPPLGSVSAMGHLARDVYFMMQPSWIRGGCCYLVLPFFLLALRSGVFEAVACFRISSSTLEFFKKLLVTLQSSRSLELSAGVVATQLCPRSQLLDASSAAVRAPSAPDARLASPARGFREHGLVHARPLGCGTLRATHARAPCADLNDSIVDVDGDLPVPTGTISQLGGARRDEGRHGTYGARPVGRERTRGGGGGTQGDGRRREVASSLWQTSRTRHRRRGSSRGQSMNRRGRGRHGHLGAWLRFLRRVQKRRFYSSAQGVFQGLHTVRTGLDAGGSRTYGRRTGRAPSHGTKQEL